MNNEPAPLTLDEINRMDHHAFVDALGGVFEHSPWVVERAWTSRPFSGVADLHAAMVRAVREATAEEQTALLRAHPELAGREARSATLTASSAAEQASAGLNALDRTDRARIAGLNRAYREKFGHPFIIAVRNTSKQGIFSEFERRLGLDARAELANCLEQVFMITNLRLDKLFGAA